MRSTLSENVGEQRRQRLKPCLIFQCWEKQRLCRSCLVLGHLCLVEEAVADNRLGELIFWMITSPGKKVSMACIGQYAQPLRDSPYRDLPAGV